MCYDVYMPVKDPKLCLVGVGYRVPVAGICLSFCNLHLLKGDVDVINQTSKRTINMINNSC